MQAVRRPGGADAPPRRLHALTALRFFASAYVVLFHARRHEELARLPAWAKTLIGGGDSAVSFFFVLSGFILALNYGDAFVEGRARVASFWAARFARIYPLYAIAILADAYVREIRRGTSLARVVVGTIAQLLCIQSSVSGLIWFGNVPGWSIATEVAFYALFPFIILRGWRTKSVIGGLAGMTAAWVLELFAAPVVLHATVGPASLLNWFSPVARVGEFVVGIYLARVFVLTASSPRLRRLSGWLLAGAVAAAVGVLLQPSIPYFPKRNGLVAPLFALIILAAAHENPCSRVLSVRPLLLLGEASYAIYILQDPLEYVLGEISAIPKDAALWTYFAVLLALSLASARFLEPPLRRLVVRLIARRLDTAPRREPRSRGEVLWLTVPAVALFLGSLLMLRGASVPVLAEEFSTWRVASLLARAAPPLDPEGSPLLAFAHAPLVDPALWFPSAPHDRYAVALACNALAAAALYIPLAALCARIAAVDTTYARPRALSLIAFAACLLPAYAFDVSFLGPRATFAFVFACASLCAHAMAARPTAPRAALLGGACAVACALGPMGVSVVGAAGLVVGVVAWRRRPGLGLVAAWLAVTLIGLVAGRIVQASLIRELGWQAAGAAANGGTTLLTGAYAITSAVLAVIARGLTKTRGPLEENGHFANREIGLFLGTSVAAALVLEVFARTPDRVSMMSAGVSSVDPTSLVAPCFVAVLVWASGSGAARSHGRLPAIVACIGAAIFACLARSTLRTPDLLVLGLTSVTLAVAYFLTSRRPIHVVVLLIWIGALAGFRYWTFERAVMPMRSATHVSAELLDTLAAIPKGVISYDVSHAHWPRLRAYQFLATGRTFTTFASAAGEVPTSNVVMSVVSWHAPTGFGLRWRAKDSDEALWVRDDFLLIGTSRVAGVPETGFHGTELVAKRPHRWTNGLATLEVPLDDRIPRKLRVSLGAGPPGGSSPLTIRANDTTLYAGDTRYPWHQTLELPQLHGDKKLRIEIKSATFVPAKLDAASGDTRVLGVFVEDLVLE